MKELIERPHPSCSNRLFVLDLSWLVRVGLATEDEFVEVLDPTTNSFEVELGNDLLDGAVVKRVGPVRRSDESLEEGEGDGGVGGEKGREGCDL